jgi:5-methylcytosine-specific restriction endonuclease McrA
MSRACSVEGCDRRHNSHGLCAMHGMRLARRGDVHDPGRLVRSNGSCSIDGCERKHAGLGMCGMHYQRFRNGRTNLPETLVCARCARPFPRPFKANPAAVRFCSHECRYANQLEQARENSAGRYARLLEWRKKNPDRLKASQLRRDAKKRASNADVVTGRDLARLAQRFGGKCAYCSVAAYKHIDHVVPLSRGGRHSIGNLLPACSSCNLSKGAKLLAEFRYLKPVPRRFRGKARAAKASVMAVTGS